MKTRTNLSFPLRILGFYAGALGGLFLLFSLMSWVTRSFYSDDSWKIPDEKAVAEELLSEKLQGPRYFHLEPETPETPHPYLSSYQARQQIVTVAQERHLDPAGVARVEKLIEKLTEPSPSRILGTDRVNVWRLNLALDQLQ